jgi:hypothetical protein
MEVPREPRPKRKGPGKMGISAQPLGKLLVRRSYSNRDG